MKLPFSYKDQFFMPLLAISFAGHFALWGVHTLSVQPPQFGMEHGPSSVEVVLLEEKKIEKVEKASQVMTALGGSSEETVLQPKNEEVPEKVVKKNVVLPQQNGAITDLLKEHLKNHAPVYPDIARENGWEGTVLLEVSVSKAGKVDQVRVIQSSRYKVLDESAVRAVRKWRFSPARLGQMFFSSSIQIPVRFVLTKSET